LTIRGQPKARLVFHRPLAFYINLFLRAGFVLDGWAEARVPERGGPRRPVRMA
jgi:hypothetical protein